MEIDDEILEGAIIDNFQPLLTALEEENEKETEENDEH